jgi:hypothetical protein
VILRVYIDESNTNKAELLGGFMATSEEWNRFSRRWKVVLNNFAAPYFHFREFADKENKNKIPNNPFIGWCENKRDSFLHELAIVLSESAVPVGAVLDLAKFRSKEFEGERARAGVKDGDRVEMLIGRFYVHFSEQLNLHWPGFDGHALFVFDQTDNDEWVATLKRIHNKAQALEKRIGGIAFENDKRCPPLQAADLFAYAARQNSEKFYHQGRTKQRKRTLDWILSKNFTIRIKREFTGTKWEKLVRLVLADRKQKRALWAKQGEPNRPYIPELDFEPQKHGLRLIDPEQS